MNNCFGTGASASVFFYREFTAAIKFPLIFAYICGIIYWLNIYYKVGCMQDNRKIEIERKFLIRYPDVEFLQNVPGCVCTMIEQTYLLCDVGSLRVRKSVSDGKVRYFRNLKRNITDISRHEDEKIISEEIYSELLLCADKERKTVAKTRYAIPYMGHIMEIDVFPFWNDRAFLEVELGAEDEEFAVPSYIEIIKEVTQDKRYTNKALAKEVITEEL